jgi:hypothetical protein
MIARDSLVAGVLAATDKMVQQVGSGDWQAAQGSSAERRVLLDQLLQQEPQAAEHGFLRALREAAAESEAALFTMRQQAGATGAARTPIAGSRLCTKA